MKYQKGDFQISEKQSRKYFLPQIMYLPAERNFICIIKEAKSFKSLPDSLLEYIRYETHLIVKILYFIKREGVYPLFSWLPLLFFYFKTRALFRPFHRFHLSVVVQVVAEVAMSRHFCFRMMTVG